MAALIQAAADTMLTNHQTTATTTTTLDLLSPALANTFYFCTALQRLLSTSTLFLLFRIYNLSLPILKEWHVLSLHSINASRLLFLHSLYLSHILFINSLWASQLLLISSWYASRVLLIQSWYAGLVLRKSCVWGFWKWWKVIEPFRQKLFFEFMVFILAHGRHLVLVVFWPGWIVIGGVASIGWCVLG